MYLNEDGTVPMRNAEDIRRLIEENHRAYRRRLYRERMHALMGEGLSPQEAEELLDDRALKGILG